MLTGMVLPLINSSFAQDSTSAGSLTINGSADMYYKYDFGRTKTNNLTSFTNSHNSFELGMASVKFSYKIAKVEMVADLGFGKRAQEFSYNDAGILPAVKQLYMSYLPSKWLKLTAGSWATHVGYELVDAYANRNYSMSYMFTNGPFFHTGAKAEAVFGKSGLMIGLANPTDFKYVPDGRLNDKTFLAQYSYIASDRFKAYVNLVSGVNVDTSKTTQYDVVLTSKLNGKFSLGYNGTLFRTKVYLGDKLFQNTKSCWSSALYVNFDASKTFGLTLREEFFNDDNQLKMFRIHSKGGSILASTLSANIHADNFVFIPEIRMDKASQDIFVNNSGKPVKTTANFLLAAVYQF